MLILAVSCGGQGESLGEDSFYTPPAYSPFHDDTIEGKLYFLPEQERETALAETRRILVEALPKTERQRSPRETVLELNWFLHTHFGSIDPEPYDFMEVLKQRTGQCGSMSLVMHLALRQLGFKTRGIAMFGVPYQVSHTALEVWWDDAWHFIDPSFGAFITADGTLEGDLLAMATIWENRAKLADNVFYAVGEGRLGPQYAAARPETLYSATMTTLDPEKSGDYRLFLKYTRNYAALEPGAEVTLSYRVNLQEDTSYALGIADGSFVDIAQHTTRYPLFDSAGMQMLGNHNTSHGPLFIRNRYIVAGLSEGDRVQIIIHLVEGNPNDIVITSPDAIFQKRLVFDNVLVFDIEARSETAEVVLSVQSPKTRIFFDAFEFGRRKGQ